jgi:hypothetical protein
MSKAGIFSVVAIATGSVVAGLLAFVRALALTGALPGRNLRHREVPTRKKTPKVVMGPEQLQSRVKWLDVNLSRKSGEKYCLI